MKNKWQVKRLEDVATLTMGQSPPSSSYNDKGVGVPFFQGKPPNIDSFGVAVPTQYTTEPTKIVTVGTALMTVRAPVGDIFTTPTDVCIGRGLSGIKASEEVFQEYLNYQLQFASQQFQTLSQGSTFSAINSSDLKGIQISLPSYKIQKKIADILSSVDEAIQKTDHIIQKTDSLKRGLVAQIVRTSNNYRKYKIKDISEVTSSKRVMVSDYVSDGIPFYRSTEIVKKSKNIPVYDPLYISKEKFKTFKERFGAPQEGDILITAVGTIGDVYLVQKETFYFKDGNTVWIRKIKNIVFPEYLKSILSSNYYREVLNNISGGSSQKALTINKLENIEIPIPSIFEQKRIVNILSSVDQKIQINHGALDRLLLLKRGVMQDIFSQKVEIS